MQSIAYGRTIHNVISVPPGLYLQATTVIESDVIKISNRYLGKLYEVHIIPEGEPSFTPRVLAQVGYTLETLIHYLADTRPEMCALRQKLCTLVHHNLLCTHLDWLFMPVLVADKGDVISVVFGDRNLVAEFGPK